MNHSLHHHFKQRWIFWLIVLVVILLGAACKIWGSSLWLKTQAKGYQAVFLSNNQVYFGHLSVSGKFYKLTDIYYLQTSQNQSLQQGTDTTKTEQPKIQLVKLGEELHGPDNEMFIERDKIMFWENMKDDSKVVQAINSKK